MAQLTVIALNEGNGTDIIYTAAATGGDTFAWSGNTLFQVVNSGASSIDVTIAPAISNYTQQGIGELSKATIQHSVAAGGTATLDTRSRAFLGGGGQVQVTYSDVTSVTVAATQHKSL